jgi:hypothetical protein
MMSKRRVVVLDDHPIARHGLSQLLAGDPEIEVGGEAEDVAAVSQTSNLSDPAETVNFLGGRRQMACCQRWGHRIRRCDLASGSVVGRRAAERQDRRCLSAGGCFG